MFELCFLWQCDLKIAYYVKREAIVRFESKLVITDDFGMSVFSCNETKLERVAQHKQEIK